MRKTTVLCFFAVCLISALAFSSGCNGGKQSSRSINDRSGALDLQLDFDAGRGAGSTAAQRGGGDICADLGIETIDIEVFRSSEKLAGNQWPCLDHTGTVEDVPAGTGLTVVATAISQGRPTWRGESLDVTVVEGQNTAVTVQMTQIGGESPPVFATISATAGTGGTISPQGPVSVAHGASQHFSISALPGFTLSRLLVNGMEVAPTSDYTFESISSDQTIEAFFAINTNLRHRWSFNGDTMDIGGSDAVIADPDGAAGNGGHMLSESRIRLDGGEQAQAEYLSMGADLLPVGPVTLEFWVTRHSTADSSPLFYFGNGAGEYLKWNLSDNADQNKLIFKDIQENASPVHYGPLEINSEYHIAVIILPGGGKIGNPLISWHIGRASDPDLGIAKGTMESANPMVDFNDAVGWLGRSPLVQERSCITSYNEVRIWDGALTLDQLEYLHELGPDAIRPLRLAHRWSFNNDLSDTQGGVAAQILDPDRSAQTGGTVTAGLSEISLSGGSNASSQYVNLGSGLLSGGNQFTIELWATQHAVRSWSRIFDYGTGYSEHLMMSWTSLTNVANDRVKWIDGSTSVESNNSNAPYLLGQKYHIVMVLDSSIAGSTSVRWYTAPATDAAINQKDRFEVFSLLSDFSASSSFWLGRSRYSQDETAQASYDEVRIWEGILTPQAIRANHWDGPEVVAHSVPTSP